jgi:hypothetical protein
MIIVKLLKQLHSLKILLIFGLALSSLLISPLSLAATSEKQASKAAIKHQPGKVLSIKYDKNNKMYLVKIHAKDGVIRLIRVDGEKGKVIKGR